MLGMHFDYEECHVQENGAYDTGTPSANPMTHSQTGILLFYLRLS